MYNKVKDDAIDIYLYNIITKVARYKYKKSNNNMQIICHIRKEKNTNKINLIDIKVFKPINKNTTK